MPSQIRRFAASGVINTLSDYAVFMLLTKIFSVPLERVWIAKLISGGLAMAVSFLLNRGWVFASPDARRSEARLLRQLGRSSRTLLRSRIMVA